MEQAREINQLKHLKGQNEKLEERTKTLQQSNNEQDDQIEKHDEEFEKLQEQNCEKDRQVRQMKYVTNEKDVHIGEKTQQIENLKDRIENLKDRIVNLKQQITDKGEQISEQGRKIEELEKLKSENDRGQTSNTERVQQKEDELKQQLKDSIDRYVSLQRNVKTIFVAARPCLTSPDSDAINASIDDIINMLPAEADGDGH